MGPSSTQRRKKKRFLIRRGVERIGKNCFYESNLVSLTIPSSVTKISKEAFYYCHELKFIYFAKKSRLIKIGKDAFNECLSLKKIKFPKSLKVIKLLAFNNCESLEDVSFPDDSQLERIEAAFQGTKIRHLFLPPSIRELDNVCDGMCELESVHVKNELYASNEEGTMILSQDGSEFIYTISFKYFAVPEGVRIIRKYAMICSNVFIPASVEVIEENVFYWDEINIEFAPGSKLRSLDFKAFARKPESLLIDNENFVTMYDGVVVSLNPRGIVFVPEHLTEIEIDPNVEVIYSHAFQGTSITSLHFPKSLKKIFSFAFSCNELKYIIFEEGTDLEFLDEHAFNFYIVDNVCVHVSGKLFKYKSQILELPPDLSPDCKLLFHDYLDIIICPRSSLLTIAQQNYLSSAIRLDII